MTAPETRRAFAGPATPEPLRVRVMRTLAVALGLGLVFAWLGVYQTAQFPFVERVIYWSGLMLLGIASGTVISPLVAQRWLPDAHPALQIAVITVVISVPITAGLIAIEAASDGSIAPVEWWWMQYLYVLVISGLLTSLAWALDRYTHATATAQQAPAPAAAGNVPAFAERLPAKFRAAEIHAVSAEDHYLRVHTSAGETMILMRLADAIRELATLEGMQTHRSWWVAKGGLADAAKGDGKVTLKLKSGAEAPVSRTYLKAVKDAGWL